MSEYRKKPVVIEAVQFDGTLRGLAVVNHALGAGLTFRPSLTDSEVGDAVVRTLEGEMTAHRGDYIIRGVKGEFYPCKPDIFAATYEAVDPVTAPTPDAVARAREALVRVLSLADKTSADGGEAIYDLCDALGIQAYSIHTEIADALIAAVRAECADRVESLGTKTVAAMSTETAYRDGKRDGAALAYADAVAELRSEAP